MDSIHIFNLRFKKSNAFAKRRMVQIIATLFRFIELFFLLVIISRFSAQFAFSVKFSGDYFNRISSTLLNPLFVFLIGNAIVITLFLKSGWLSEKYSTTGNKSSSDFCAEFVEKSVGDYQRREDTVVFGTDQNFTERKIDTTQSDNLNRGEEKQSINRGDEKQSIGRGCEKQIVSCTDQNVTERKIYRSQSENLNRGGERQSTNRGDEKQSINRGGEKQSRKLRRSVTENVGKFPSAVSSYAEEEMSGEEFRQSVETFIARQQKFLREEEFCC